MYRTSSSFFLLPVTNVKAGSSDDMPSKEPKERLEDDRLDVLFKRCGTIKAFTRDTKRANGKLGRDINLMQAATSNRLV